jgi:hypothetical protein
MYPATNIGQLSGLIGKELIGVFLSQCHLGFHFADDCSITVDGRLKFRKLPSDSFMLMAPPFSGEESLPLLGRNVAALITGANDLDMLVRFESGEELYLCGDECFEAYHIQIGNNEFHY